MYGNEQGRHREEGATPDDLRDIGQSRRGRHAADPPVHGRRAVVSADSLDDPANLAPLLAPTSRAKVIARLSLATGAVALAAAGAGAAVSAPGKARQPDRQPETAQQPVVAPKAVVRAPRVQVRTSARPVPVAKPLPAPSFRPAPPPPAVAPVVQAPAPAVAPPRVVVRPAPAPVPAPVPVAPAPPAGTYAPRGAIADAALAQLGRFQDCTMLVTNALRAVGINFHDWPAGYLSLGAQVAPEQAGRGDLVYYANGGTGVPHIAVYLGGGMAVHGGWNGNQTVTFSANVGSGPVYIRVR